jgi:hypothetical protein
MEKKYRKTSTSVRFSPADRKHIAWLRKHFGGIAQSSVVTMALTILYERQRGLEAVSRKFSDGPIATQEALQK